MDEKRCLDCEFFDEVNAFCRCLPPVPTIKKLPNGDSKIMAMFPIIKRPDSDWCGQFTEMEEK